RDRGRRRAMQRCGCAFEPIVRRARRFARARLAGRLQPGAACRDCPSRPVRGAQPVARFEYALRANAPRYRARRLAAPGPHTRTQPTWTTRAALRRLRLARRAPAI